MDISRKTENFVVLQTAHLKRSSFGILPQAFLQCFQALIAIGKLSSGGQKRINQQLPGPLLIHRTWWLVGKALCCHSVGNKIQLPLPIAETSKATQSYSCSSSFLVSKTFLQAVIQEQLKWTHQLHFIAKINCGNVSSILNMFLNTLSMFNKF